MSRCQTCPNGCATDHDADFHVSPDYERFSQKRDIFSRSFWDSTIHSTKTRRFYESYRRPLRQWRRVDGYEQKDFALRNAAWHVADLFAERLETEDRREGFLDYLTAHRDSAQEQREVTSTDEMAREIKRAASASVRTIEIIRVGSTSCDSPSWAPFYAA